MTVRKVPFRRRLAVDDIAGHSQRIAENNFDAALRFLDAVEATAELLCQFPEAGGGVPTNRADAIFALHALGSGLWGCPWCVSGPPLP